MSQQKFRPSSEAKRQAIIEAAGRAFFENGYEGASIEAIAADAGVSKVTVYNHFGGKPALLTAAVEHECGQMEQHLSLDHVAALPIRERLTALGLAFNAFLSRPEIVNFDRRIAAETERDPAIGETFLDAGPRRMHSQLTELFAYAAREGELAIDDPAMAAEQFASMCKGFGDLERRFSGCTDEAVAARRVGAAVDLFMKAYAP